MSLIRIVIALVTTSIALLAPSPAAAGFQAPKSSGELTVSGSAPYIHGDFRADGSFELLHGSTRYPWSFPMRIFRHHPHGLAPDDRWGNFGTYLDYQMLEADDMADEQARIVTDSAGNTAAAWRTTCTEPTMENGYGQPYTYGCVRAITRPAGQGWSIPVTISNLDEPVADYSTVFVALQSGRPVISWVSEVAPGEYRAKVVTGYINGSYNGPDDLMGLEVPNDGGGGGERHLQDVVVDDAGGIWFVVANYDERAILAISRATPDGAWRRERMNVAPYDTNFEINGTASIAAGGPTVLATWRRHVGDGLDATYVINAASCDPNSGTCEAPEQISDTTQISTNPRAAVDADGNGLVTWLETPPNTPYFALRARDAELRPEGLQWAADVETIQAQTVGGGVASVSMAGTGMHDVAFTADGTAIAAWRLDRADGARTTWAAARGGAAAAWTPELIDSTETTPNGRLPSIEVVTDEGGDAAIVWPRELGMASDGGYMAQVVPFDVTAPVITTPPSGGSIPAGTTVELGVDVVDTWSAVPDANIEWNFAGQTGRRITGCFTTPGDVTARVVATDAAGNQSAEASFTFEVTGSATTCATGDPDPDAGSDPEPDPGTGGDGGTSGGDGGTAPTPTTPQPTAPQPTVPTPTAPQPFVLTDTMSRDKVPNVVGLTASAARDRFDRAGIGVDFDIRMVSRAKAPRGITIGEVMAQTPRGGSVVETAIRDREAVRLDVYAGPVVGRPTASSCSVTKVSAAVKGLELDLAKLVLKSMKCPYQVDVRPVVNGDDAAVTGATSRKGIITLGVNVPRKPSNNDVLLTFRENPNGISFASGDWTLTAGQKNAFTFQATPKVLVDGKLPLLQKAIVTIDMSGVGGAKNLTGQTDANGEKITIAEPPRAGFIDILVEFPTANDISLWGTARLKVVDRSKQKVGSRIATVSGRVFQKHATGVWTHVPGASLTTSKSRDARFLDFGGMVAWMQQAVAGIGGSIGSAFSNKGQSSEQVLSTALTKAKVSPSQMLITDSLVSGNVKPIELGTAQVVSAGGGNVVSAGGGNVVAPGGGNVVAPGGGNVVAPGGGNVVSAGGGNVVAAGGGNVVAAGGANGIAASAPGLIAMGAAGVIAAGGGNVVAAGGGNVVAAGGGNLIIRN